MSSRTSPNHDVISIRKDLVQRAKDLIEPMQAKAPPGMPAKITKSGIIQQALEMGLEFLEQDFPRKG